MAAFFAQNQTFFLDADIDLAAESITAYIFFCLDSIIPQKIVKQYPNKKPNITGSIKECIGRKRAVIISGDSAGVQAAQKDLSLQMRAAPWQHQ